MGLWDALTGAQKAPTMGEVQKSDYNSRSVPVMTQGYGSPEDDNLERSLDVMRNPGSHTPEEMQSLHTALTLANSVGSAGLTDAAQTKHIAETLQKMASGNPLTQVSKTVVKPNTVASGLLDYQKKTLSPKVK